MHATVGLFVALSVVVVSQATPYYYPQQRQLFYPVLPQYPQYYSPRQVYYAPSSAANLVAPVPAAVRYPVVAPPTKSVVYYGAPAIAPYPGNLVYAGGADESSESGGGWSTFLENFTGHFPSLWPSGNSPSESETASAPEGGNSPTPPEKIEQASNSEQPAKEGEEDKEKENEAEKPSKAQKVKVAPKGGPQKYVVVGQPQFFGNFGLQRVNPAAVLPTADHGAVSSYLLLKNYPGYRFGPQFPVVPQIPQAVQVPQAGLVPQTAQAPQVPQTADAADAELIPAGQPGAAALGYQKLLKDAEAARESKEYDDVASVSVDAATQDDKAAEATDDAGDKNEEEETGTSE